MLKKTSCSRCYNKGETVWRCFLSLCKACGEEIPPNELLKHLWDTHHDMMMVRAQKGHEKLHQEALARKEAKRQKQKTAAQQALKAAPPPPKPVAVITLAPAQGQEEMPESTEELPDGEKQEEKPAKNDTHAPRGGKAKTPTLAKSLDEAAFISIVPKEVRISSTLFHITKHVTEKEWNWPVMEEGEWLDTFFYQIMRKFNIVLGGYQVVKGGNGHARG